jgi:hypothetical protein
MAPSSNTAGAGIKLILYRRLLEQALSVSASTARQSRPSFALDIGVLKISVFDFMMFPPH